MKPETKESTSSPATRRKFLLGATLAGAGAVAAVVSGGSAEEVGESPTVVDKPSKPKGYHVTPHISQYYETTKF